MELTPIKPIVTFKFLNKKPRLASWKPLTWLEPDFEFNIKEIMSTFPYRQACQIINSIKHKLWKQF